MLNNLIAPTVSADPDQPGTLVVTDGAWSSSTVACRYQWRLDGFDIPGATDNVHTPDADDAGRLLTCYVAAQDAAGNLGARVSNGVVV